MKTVFISGASHGIGRSIAEKFAQEMKNAGFKVPAYGVSA